MKQVGVLQQITQVGNGERAAAGVSFRAAEHEQPANGPKCGREDKMAQMGELWG